MTAATTQTLEQRLERRIEQQEWELEYQQEAVVRKAREVARAAELAADRLTKGDVPLVLPVELREVVAAWKAVAHELQVLRSLAGKAKA